MINGCNERDRTRQDTVHWEKREEHRIAWIWDSRHSTELIQNIIELPRYRIMDDNPHVLSTDMDLFVDSQPMNDEELSRLHESTLQMFRSNKIGPKNAFDIVLIDYLPAIFEASTFEDDRINHFQSVGTTLETSGLTDKND